jgi:hypothetical protein
MDPAVRKAIAGIGEAAWTPVQYTDAVVDEDATGGSPLPKHRSPRSVPGNRANASSVVWSSAGSRT